MTQELTAGSLFAGIGGFCLGFAKHGIKTKWAIENDPAAVNTYLHNIPDVRLVSDEMGPASIKNVTVLGSKLEPVDVIHAGFPCQSFSTAGERKGFDDPRGMLFYEIIRLLKEFGEKRPSVLVLENSPYIKIGDGGSWFIELTKEIKKAGYWFRESNCIEIDSFEHTRLPQQRKRLFMIAFSTAAFRNGKLSIPEKPPIQEKILDDYIGFDGHITDDTYYLKDGNRYQQMISNLAEDKRCIYQLRKFLVRVKNPGVCPTLTANMGLGGHNVPFIYDTKGLRKLTEQECLKLQGFPDWFEFPPDVPRAKRYTQVGNSVIPLVSEIIAKVVKEKILTERQ